MIKLKTLLEIPMGKVAFGEDPEIAKIQNAEEEPDTTQEWELYKLLRKWYKGTQGQIGSQGEFSGMVSSELKAMKLDLFYLKKQFPKVFGVPDNFKVAFRGTNVSNDYTTIYELLKNAPTVYIVSNHGRYSSTPVVVIPYNYKPKSEVQSWSVRESIAETFGGIGKIKIVLVTKIDDMFIMNPDVSNEIAGLYENEVLHFGKDFMTYMSMSSYAGGHVVFQMLYEILEGYRPRALDDDTSTNFLVGVRQHKDFDKKFVEVNSYENLPW